MSSNWIEKQFDELKKLAEERFAPLSDAETKMLRAVITGDVAWCGPSDKNEDPHNDPFSTEKWGPEREIHAELVRWLCADKTAEAHVHVRGIRLHAAEISGHLILSDATVQFSLELRRCRCTDPFWLVSTQILDLDLRGSATKLIRADGAKIQGDLNLADGFTARGGVNLLRAKIDGDLNCNGGHFINPAEEGMKDSGTALDAERLSVKGAVFLGDGFCAEGAVNLHGAEIAGVLQCDKGVFKNSTRENLPSTGDAIIAESLSAADVRLRDEFHAEGRVILRRARIDGDLDCEGGTFLGGNKGALYLESATVGGDAYLRNKFKAEGEVRLIGAKIAGDLVCDGAKFDQFVAYAMTVERTFFWQNIEEGENAELYCKDASVGLLADERASWPLKGKLFVDGFVYRRISAGPSSSEQRLEWLRRQGNFTPQPYHQLAKVLRNEGDDQGARRVLYEMEKRKHQEGSHSWAVQFWGLIFRGTIGYGIYPRWALRWLLLLIVLGCGAYWNGYSRGAITPTNKEAYEAFHRNGGPPPNYQHFSALVYSAEHCFPLVNMGQKEAWTPDPNRLGLAKFLRVFRWCQILLGWALATFFVAGVTGIARKD